MAKQGNKTTSNNEIGNRHDWGELYWGGFSPNAIGAVALFDAKSSKNKFVNDGLIKTRELVINEIKNNKMYSKHDIKLKDYFVTVHDEFQLIPSTKKLKMNIKKNNNNDNTDGKDSDNITDNDNIDIHKILKQQNIILSERDLKLGKKHIQNKLKELSKKNNNQNSMQKVLCLVIRCWHKNVFLGCRLTCQANPGEWNFVSRFNCETQHFIDFKPWKD